MNERERFDNWWSDDTGSWPPRDVAWIAWQAALAQRKWDSDPACTCGTSATCYKHSGDSQSSTAPPADD